MSFVVLAEQKSYTITYKDVRTISDMYLELPIEDDQDANPLLFTLLFFLTQILKYIMLQWIKKASGTF